MSGRIEIRDLVIEAETASGRLALVEGLSLDVERGAIGALVGESGCGKSMTALAVMGLLPPRVRVASGEIRLDGTRIDNLAESDWLAIRGRRVSMIFQEPMTSLNPLHSIGAQVAEVYRIHTALGRREAWTRAVGMLKRVHIPDAGRRAGQYPHQLSGGMRQRVMIAMALAADPDFLIADEPTTALDVTIQAQILELLRELAEERRDRRGTGVLLITHDMGVVAETAATLCVMYAGRGVEYGTTAAIFRRPYHPYTIGLMNAIPRLERGRARLVAIPGQVPRPGQRPSGCTFAPRCSFVLDECRRGEIPLASRGEPPTAIMSRCLVPAPSFAPYGKMSVTTNNVKNRNAGLQTGVMEPL
jgi:peptide/nickel transport system ATP-binding protein